MKQPNIFFEPDVLTGRVCPYCKKETVETTKDKFMIGDALPVKGCLDCFAFVRLNKYGIPLGSIANGQLRRRRAELLTLYNQIIDLDTSPGMSRFDKMDLLGMQMAKLVDFPKSSILASEAGPTECDIIIPFLQGRLEEVKKGTFTFDQIKFLHTKP